MRAPPEEKSTLDHDGKFDMPKKKKRTKTRAKRAASPTGKKDSVHFTACDINEHTLPLEMPWKWPSLFVEIGRTPKTGVVVVMKRRQATPPYKVTHCMLPYMLSPLGDERIRIRFLRL